MLRKKAVGPRTKPTLSDILYDCLYRIMLLIRRYRGLLVYSLPYFGTTFKKDSRLKSGTEANLANINNADA